VPVGETPDSGAGGQESGACSPQTLLEIFTQYICGEGWPIRLAWKLVGFV
jgi:hypothetical protein